MYVLDGGAFRHEFLLVPRLPSEGIAPDHFGSSVAMGADGTSAVVGAPDADTADGLLYVGAAYTFMLP